MTGGELVIFQLCYHELEAENIALESQFSLSVKGHSLWLVFFLCNTCVSRWDYQVIVPIPVCWSMFGCSFNLLCYCWILQFIFSL